MTQTPWRAAAIPDLHGKVAIVTGAAGGLGRETARVLAGKGADVILAVRDLTRGAAVADAIRRRSPSGGRVSAQRLDLASLAAVRAFADKVAASENRLDILVNNAGVMFPPPGKTVDGFDLQFGINHLGHFALTGLLMPLLRATGGARVVPVASVAHKSAQLDLADPNWEARPLRRARAYSDSKLANLLFAYALARREQAAGSGVQVVVAHPGWTGSDLARHNAFVRILHGIFGQDVATGALPILRAACDPHVGPGDYYGPAGWKELRGPPVRVSSTARSHDIAAQDQLWALSERLTGVTY